MVHFLQTANFFFFLTVKLGRDTQYCPLLTCNETDIGDSDWSELALELEEMCIKMGWKFDTTFYDLERLSKPDKAEFYEGWTEDPNEQEVFDVEQYYLAYIENPTCPYPFIPGKLMPCTKPLTVKAKLVSFFSSSVRFPFPLNEPTIFHHGVYLLFYIGEKPLYNFRCGSKAIPIYVGKSEKATIMTHLKSHVSKLEKAQDLSIADFEFSYIHTLRESAHTCEMHLISHFSPLWNRELLFIW
jgi:hypothetical protein